MGLIKAATQSVSTLLQDQWREYFYCDSISSDLLVVKGQVRNTNNNKGVDNIISNGSIVAVNEGQCMLIVDQGAIVDFCAEAGEFVFDTSTEPSLLYGPLGENLKKSFAQFGRRFTFGGNTAKDQRVYYVNTKEIMKNLFGTTNAVPFRVVDKNIGLDLDTAIRCNGEYSFQIKDPLVFYKRVTGNVTESYNKSEMASLMKSELLTALQPAFAKISEMGIRYSAISGHTTELTQILNEELSEKWMELRGIEIVSMTINSLTIPTEDAKMIADLQKTAVFRQADMAAANISSAQAEAMKAAASNTSTGPMMAFAGMNMAQMTGGMDANTLFAMGAAQKQNAPQAQPASNPAPAMQPAGGAILGWSCSCGKSDNRGRFCAECGKPKPAEAGWTCSCGATNQGKFCAECGKPKPAGAPLYKCDKCGWEPEDPSNPPKFCPECGDVFDEKDVR